jgi:hypothetical protein
MFGIKKHIKVIILLAMLSLVEDAFSQLICEDSKQTITLSDHTIVYAYTSKYNAKLVYYVPTEFRISTKQGIPEFLFQKFKHKGSKTLDGAIMHLYLTWGLSVAHLKELKTKVKILFGEDVRVGGALDLKSLSDVIKFNTNNPIGRILKNALTSKGFPPNTGSSKMALSFKIKKEHVKQVDFAFKNSSKLKNVTLSLSYEFNTVTCSKSYAKQKKNTLVITGYFQKWF